MGPIISCKPLPAAGSMPQRQARRARHCPGPRMEIDVLYSRRAHKQKHAERQRRKPSQRQTESPHGAVSRQLSRCCYQSAHGQRMRDSSIAIMRESWAEFRPSGIGRRDRPSSFLGQLTQRQAEMLRPTFATTAGPSERFRLLDSIHLQFSNQQSW